MKNRLFKSLPGIALALLHLSSAAEDIDLFVNAQAAADAGPPNVLIIVDNTANWNQAFANEMAALANTLKGLPDDKFRIGLMFAVETGNPNNNVDGGYVRAAIRTMDGTTKPKYEALVKSFDKLNDKGNGGVSSLVMAEAYNYLSGKAPYAGNGKVKTDYAGNTYGTAESKAIYALTGNALGSMNSTRYVSPVTESCQKNFIIYLSNGPAGDNKTAIDTSNQLLKQAGGDATTISISPSGSQANPIDEWARYLKQSPLAVTTYTIDIDPVTNGQGPGWSAILKSMAGVSNGKYFAVSSGKGGADISDALLKSLSEIQAVNSVFSSVSLPISVNTQGTYLNQVYIGMFRPDSNDFPRWAGNLKQYKLGYINNQLQMLDADSASAINSQTGFITECARSFWTPTTADDYWSFRPQGDCLPPTGSSAGFYKNSNYPDGNIVEKGGQAYQLRRSTARNVKTCSPVFASCTSLTSFDTDNAAITEGLIGAASSTERAALINWARGQDLQDENNNGVKDGEMRPSAHGDVVHSHPVAINYGTDADPQIVVFYGANDGALRAINGNRSTAIGSVPAGGELWSFIAPESYGVLKRIRDNNVQVSTPNISGQPKPYAIDGPITAYQDTHQDTSRAWIFATMRRGGRAIYAFDVTDPASPSLKWKKGCPSNFPSSGAVDDSGCSTGMEGIGQTWAAAKPLKASGYGSGESPMLIIGGGYDPCEDADPNTCGDSTKGNKLYVLDADTGALLRTLDTQRPVVGDVIVAPDSGTGLAKHAYASDMGGNVYRINIGGNAPADWTITRIAALGCDTVTACSANRKFMFAPDVVQEEEGLYVLLLGSGDREKPLSHYASAYGVTNYFFMLKDKPGDDTWLTAEQPNCSGNAVICLNSLLAISGEDNPTQASVDEKKGWYLGMAEHEQVVTAAITLYGVVTFSTHQPAVTASGTCNSNLGTANVYNIAYTNAAPSVGTSRFQQVAGGGLPPSPKAGLVRLDDGQTVPFVIGATSSSPLEAGPGIPPSSSVTKQPKRRVYWYVEQ
jgi:type IV pilus assembly protein PilY1